MPSDHEHRLHPWSVLFSLLSQIRQFAVPVLLALVVGSRGGNFELLVLPFLVPYTGFVVIRYFSFRYTFEAEELVIRSGLFFKNERHIPYTRIQNLDAVQNALHRVLGVVDARVDTGSGSEIDASLSVISWPAYVDMRRRVLGERSGAPAEAAGVAAGDPSPAASVLLALPSRDLTAIGLIENRATVLIAAVMGLVWESGLLEAGVSRLGIETVGRGVIRDALTTIYRDGAVPMRQAVPLVGGIIGLLVLLRLFSVAWALVRLHGYRLSLVGTDLRAEYGLLTRVTTTIPLHRIQTLTVRRGLFHRWAGRTTVRVETAGGDGPGRGSTRRRESLAPIISVGDVPAFLRAVLPDLDLTQAGWNEPAPRAVRRELNQRLVLAAIGTAPFIWLLPWWSVAVGATLAAWAAVSARIYIAHLRWATVDGAVLLRTGWLWQHMTVARFSKVQAVTMTMSPFDRRHRMASLRVDTAGSSDATHRVAIPYLPHDVAVGLYARVATAAATSRFHW